MATPTQKDWAAATEMVEIRRLVSEICSQTDRHAGRNTRSAPGGSRDGRKVDLTGTVCRCGAVSNVAGETLAAAFTSAWCPARSRTNLWPFTAAGAAWWPRPPCRPTYSRRTTTAYTDRTYKRLTEVLGKCVRVETFSTKTAFICSEIRRAAFRLLSLPIFHFRPVVHLTPRLNLRVVHM